MKTLEKMKKELSLEYVKKDDESIGHCPDCFCCGFDAAIKALSEIGIDGAIKYIGQTIGENGMTSYNSFLRKKMDQGDDVLQTTELVLVPHLPVAAQILQLNNKIEELEKKLNISENDELRMIGERDFWEKRVDELADALGDETEWTSHNCRFENALELAHAKDQKIEQLEAENKRLSKELEKESLKLWIVKEYHNGKDTRFHNMVNIWVTLSDEQKKNLIGLTNSLLALSDKGEG